jgi:hypothetical protein
LDPNMLFSVSVWIRIRNTDCKIEALTVVKKLHKS